MSSRSLRASSAALALILAACAPELGSEPFACGDGATCPEGYTCRSAVCVVDGESPALARALRVTYINRSELAWFASPRGGATLLANDGFSPGELGIYEIHVAPDGQADPPVKLVDFPGTTPVSSAMVAIDDARYGIVTMRFPGELEDDVELAIQVVPREGSGAPPTLLHRATYPYVGGYEPAYVGAAVSRGGIAYAFTDAGEGGAVVVTEVAADGAVVGSQRIPLPEGVLPLSADCLLWRAADGGLMLRVGLERMRVFRLDLEEGTAELVPEPEGVAGTPLFGFGGSIAYLEPDPSGTQASYVLRDLDGDILGQSAPQAFTEGLEPYTAVAYGAGALLAPLSEDASFRTLDVGYMGPDGSFTRAARIERRDTDELYTARAFATGGTAYLAWTTFHEQLMDVWVGVAPITGVP